MQQSRASFASRVCSARPILPTSTMRNPAVGPVLETASRPSDPEDVKASKSPSLTPNASAKPPASSATKLRIADPEMEKAVEEINSALDAKPKSSD